MLKIGFPPTLMRRWGAAMLTAFASAHPQTWVEVYPCRHDLDFATSALDLAFVRGTRDGSGARSRVLFQEELVVVGAPELLPPEGLSIDEALLDYPLIQNSSRPSLWLHWLRGAGVHYKSRIYGPRLPNFDMILECAVNGMGLAVVPELHV